MLGTILIIVLILMLFSTSPLEPQPQLGLLPQRGPGNRVADHCDPDPLRKNLVFNAMDLPGRDPARTTTLPELGGEP